MMPLVVTEENYQNIDDLDLESFTEMFVETNLFEFTKEISKRFINLDFLDMSYLELTEIPKNLPRSVISLILTGNEIEVIENLKYMSNLEYLDLDDNQLTAVDFTTLPRWINDVLFIRNHISLVIINNFKCPNDRFTSFSFDFKTVETIVFNGRRFTDVETFENYMLENYRDDIFIFDRSTSKNINARDSILTIDPKIEEEIKFTPSNLIFDFESEVIDVDSDEDSQ